MRAKVNAYNVFDEEHASAIIYHAVAEDERQVIELAEAKGIDISGLCIDLERKDVRDQLGMPFEVYIEKSYV